MVQAQPLKVTFNTDIPAWEIKQKVIRRVFDPQAQNGSSYVEPRLITDWELKSIHVNFYIAMIELLELACTDGPNPLQIESIDLGPVDPSSALVQTIVSGMESLTI